MPIDVRINHNIPRDVNNRLSCPTRTKEIEKVYRFRSQPLFIHHCTYDHARHHHVTSSHQEQRHSLRSQVYRQGTPGLERETYSIPPLGDTWAIQKYLLCVTSTDVRRRMNLLGKVVQKSSSVESYQVMTFLRFGVWSFLDVGVTPSYSLSV